jgi:hypothetical protein
MTNCFSLPEHADGRILVRQTCPCLWYQLAPAGSGPVGQLQSSQLDLVHKCHDVLIQQRRLLPGCKVATLLEQTPQYIHSINSGTGQ